jgi:hypothetical protein
MRSLFLRPQLWLLAGVAVIVVAVVVGLLTRTDSLNGPKSTTNAAHNPPVAAIVDLNKALVVVHDRAARTRTVGSAASLITALRHAKVPVDPRGRTGVALRRLSGKVVELCVAQGSQTVCEASIEPRGLRASVYGAGLRQARRELGPALRDARASTR